MGTADILSMMEVYSLGMFKKFIFIKFSEIALCLETCYIHAPRALLSDLNRNRVLIGSQSRIGYITVHSIPTTSTASSTSSSTSTSTSTLNSIPTQLTPSIPEKTSTPKVATQPAPTTTITRLTTTVTATTSPPPSTEVSITMASTSQSSTSSTPVKSTVHNCLILSSKFTLRIFKLFYNSRTNLFQ